MSSNFAPRDCRRATSVREHVHADPTMTALTKPHGAFQRCGPATTSPTSYPSTNHRRACSDRAYPPSGGHPFRRRVPSECGSSSSRAHLRPRSHPPNRARALTPTVVASRPSNGTPASSPLAWRSGSTWCRATDSVMCAGDRATYGSKTVVPSGTGSTNSQDLAAHRSAP